MLLGEKAFYKFFIVVLRYAILYWLINEKLNKIINSSISVVVHTFFMRNLFIINLVLGFQKSRDF